MTVFHLVRHGDRRLAGSWPAACRGVGLTERGRAEIAGVAERLAGDKVAALYASPLQRTRKAPRSSPPGSACRSAFATI